MGNPIRPLRWHDRLRYRVKIAIVTVPTAKDWQYAFILLGLFGVISLPIGFRTGFLVLQAETNPGLSLQVAAGALVMPSLIEEFLFRVLLIPHRTEAIQPLTRRHWIIASWLIFLLYRVHPWTPDFFRTPTFLIGVGLLGTICTFSYLHSRSIWPAIFLHWSISTIWLLALGGLAKFQ